MQTDRLFVIERLVGGTFWRPMEVFSSMPLAAQSMLTGDRMVTFYRKPEVPEGAGLKVQHAD